MGLHLDRKKGETFQVGEGKAAYTVTVTRHRPRYAMLRIDQHRQPAQNVRLGIDEAVALPDQKASVRFIRIKDRFTKFEVDAPKSVPITRPDMITDKHGVAL